MLVSVLLPLSTEELSHLGPSGHDFVSEPCLSERSEVPDTLFNSSCELRGDPAALPSSDLSKSRRSASLKASCSRWIFPALSLTAVSPSRYSRSSMNSSKSRFSAKLIKPSASSSSKSSFSASVIAHSGLCALSCLPLGRAAPAWVRPSLSSFSLRTPSRWRSACAFTLSLRWLSSSSAVSMCICSISICLWSCRSHFTCFRSAALGPRIFTSPSSFLQGFSPSCSPCVAAIADLKGGAVVLNRPEASGRLQSMTPLKFPMPATGGIA
mmetsp:Transcript_10719/g.29821  ORF Transcript_10719/g.29821 Transcript_10719/m.29821 type:complete len:268 (-) Transcript_10719:62-865(-)